MLGLLRLMEPGGEREQRELRRQAAEYYQRHEVPQRLEEALNATYPLRPADLYGHLVAEGGGSAHARLERGGEGTGRVVRRRSRARLLQGSHHPLREAWAGLGEGREGSRARL